MRMDTVFFDASVLFKAAVTGIVLGAALSGEYRPAWSEAVIDERGETSSQPDDCRLPPHLSRTLS